MKLSDPQTEWAAWHIHTNRASEATLELYRQPLKRYLATKTRNVEDCEDLVQEILVTALRSLPSLRCDASLSRWLWRITANHLKNYYGRYLGKRRRELSLEQIGETEGQGRLANRIAEGPAAFAEHNTLLTHLRAAIDSACTPPEAAVLKRVLLGEKLTEVAEALHINQATARSHCYRGRTKLLTHLVAQEARCAYGKTTILEAIARANASCNRADHLTAEEERALFHPCRNAKPFREACLKIVKYMVEG